MYSLTGFSDTTSKDNLFVRDVFFLASSGSVERCDRKLNYESIEHVLICRAGLP